MSDHGECENAPAFAPLPSPPDSGIVNMGREHFLHFVDEIAVCQSFLPSRLVQLRLHQYQFEDQAGSNLVRWGKKATHILSPIGKKNCCKHGRPSSFFFNLPRYEGKMPVCGKAPKRIDLQPRILVAG